jgi:hypothetical protein
MLRGTGSVTGIWLWFGSRLDSHIFIHDSFSARVSVQHGDQSRVGSVRCSHRPRRHVSQHAGSLDSTHATPSGPLTLTHPTYTVLYPIYVDRSRSHSSPCRSPTATRTSIAVPHSQLQIGVYFEASKPPSTLSQTSHIPIHTLAIAHSSHWQRSASAVEQQ